MKVRIVYSRSILFLLVLYLLQAQNSPLFAFVLRGSVGQWDSVVEHFSDPEKTPESSVFSSNISKKFSIGADIADGRQTVFKVNPDSKGHFWIRSIYPILRIWLEDEKGHIFGKLEGPWAKDAEVHLPLKEIT